MTIYTDDHRRLHVAFGTEPLAESDAGFIASHDMTLAARCAYHFLPRQCLWGSVRYNGHAFV